MARHKKTASRIPLVHFVITRFSYRAGPSLTGAVRGTDWQSTDSLHGTDWWTHDDPLDPLKLEERFAVFQATCLPSILGQTCKKFTWILIIDRALPPTFKRRLERLVSKCQNETILHVYEPESPLGRAGWLRPYLVNAPPHARLVTTNLDDDDMISRNSIQEIQTRVSRLTRPSQLPPVALMGSHHIVQWDFVRSPGAPLGYVKPWTRRLPLPKGRFAASAGFTCVSRYPEFDFTVLYFVHSFGRGYFGPRAPPMPPEHPFSKARETIQACAEAHGEDVSTWRNFFRFLPRAKVLMSNHRGNDQAVRISERTELRKKATGPRSFPGMSMDLRLASRIIKRYGYSDDG